MAAYNWTVNNAGTYTGDMVVRQYSSFNLGSGDTLEPASKSNGVMIFVDGDATIDGDITVKGGYLGTPADTTWNLKWIKSGETQSGNNTSSDWGNGSSAANGVESTLATILNKMPAPDSNAFNIFTGSNTGDGSGGCGYGGGATNEGQNDNNQGSPFSGGAGSGGDIGSGNNPAPTRYGGQGGDGLSGAYAMGCGAGNPTGTGNSAASSYTGGLFVLAASGNILGSGSIDCSGGSGGYASFTSVEVLYSYGGGGSGGGRIILLAGGTISSSITCNVNGGSGGGRTSSKNLNSSAYNGGAGNNGTITKIEGVAV